MKFNDTAVTPCSNSSAILARLTTPILTAQRQPKNIHIGNNDDWAACELFEANTQDRHQLEIFIRDNYAKNFGAHVDAFMPRLFGLRTHNGSLCGAFGLRTTSRKLFLEQYLQNSIETEISARYGHNIERSGIVEIGHFSGTLPGAGRALIRLLTLHLRAENFAWVCFTGTRTLRNAFSRMGLTLLDIAAADSSRLPPSARANWGTYYAQAPRVVAGEIGSGYATLQHAQTAASMERCA